MANPSRVVNGCGITMTSSTSHNTLTIGQPSSSPSLSPASSPGLAGTTTCPPSTSPGMLNQMMMMMNTTTTTPVAPGAGTASAVTNNDNHHQGPYVRIIEQPARCALRFRYECEGRSAGSIPGANATPENKTYPTIQVESFKGPAVVVVSCVTKDFPYRPHPHNLVGKDGCKKGVCTMVINNPDMICSFTSLGIQCVKRKDIEESLKLRETIKVDPFRTGFAHKNQASNIDLNVVRLCFQVFIEGPEKDKFTVPLPPVVSDPIYDKKAMSDLIITKLSHCSAPVTGSKEIILLCDRVAKDDIQVRFYEDKNGQTVWEGYADFQPNDVHKQVAISFRSPKYYNENIHQPIMVNIQLRRPSDGHTSESRPFQFLPKEVDPDGLARKRQKIEETRSIDRYLKDNTMISHMQQQPQQQQQQQQHSMSTLDYPSTSRSPFMPQQPPSPRIPDRIKIEVTESQHQKLQQQLQQQQQKLQTPMQWNDLSTGSSMIPFGSPSYQHNMMSVPSPTSVSHSIQEPTTQSTSSALPQTIPNSLSPSFSVSSSPRVSVDMSNQPLTIQQQLQQQQQQQQQPKQTLHLQHSQQSQSSFLAAQSNLNQNIILADSNQMTSNNFGTSPSNNMLQRGERQYIKNLDHSAISVNPSLVIESMLATSPSSLNSNQQTSQLQQQAGTSFTQPQILQSNQQQQQQQQQLQTNPLNNNNVESSLTEKLDSLDLDIDSHDLLNDIGLNNWLVMMDSGNNITFNSSGNINITDANTLHDSNRASNL